MRSLRLNVCSAPESVESFAHFLHEEHSFPTPTLNGVDEELQPHLWEEWKYENPHVESTGVSFFELSFNFDDPHTFQAATSALPELLEEEGAERGINAWILIIEDEGEEK